MTTRPSLTDSEILQRIPPARSREQADRDVGLRAVKAFYDAINELVVIETTRGFRWGIPKAIIPALVNASAEDLLRLTLSTSGAGLHWEDLDVQLSVPGLLIDSLGAGTVARELARRGGKAKSEAKAEAARRNGARGGRPAVPAVRAHARQFTVASKKNPRIQVLRKGPRIHVIPSKTQRGKFVVMEAGKAQPVTSPTTQAKSIKKAVLIAKQNKSAVVIHGRDGKIRDSARYTGDSNSREKRH